MDVVYVIAVWMHILTVCVWIGAMFFQDPKSTRLPSRMVEKFHGVGWYAQAVLWTTGLFMLNYRGVSIGELFSASFVSRPWGKLIWAKLPIVLLMAVFQAVVGHKGLLYPYLLAAFTIVALSVLIVRPVLF